METLFYILAAIGAIPEAYRGILWIVKRTKTKKDDEIVENIGELK